MLCRSRLSLMMWVLVGVVGGLDWMNGGCRRPKSMCGGGWMGRSAGEVETDGDGWCRDEGLRLARNPKKESHMAQSPLKATLANYSNYSKVATGKFRHFSCGRLFFTLELELDPFPLTITTISFPHWHQDINQPT